MNAIGAIALNTFREVYRNRILLSLLVFGVLLLLSGLLFGGLTISEEQRVIRSVALASMQIFGVLLAAFAGMELLATEIAGKTTSFVLSKDCGRAKFLLGKYLGALMIMTVSFAVMAGSTLILFAGKKVTISAVLIGDLVLLWLEYLLIIALALFFSTFSSPVLSFSFTLGVAIVGHLSVSSRIVAAKYDLSLAKWILDAVYFILPRFGLFSVSGSGLPTSLVMIKVSVYALFYGAVVLGLSWMTFRRKDL